MNIVQITQVALKWLHAAHLLLKYQSSASTVAEKKVTTQGSAKETFSFLLWVSDTCGKEKILEEASPQGKVW